MNADGDTSERDPVDLLAEEFLGRHRTGERIEVEAFADRHPTHAAVLRELLPTLLALEQLKREKETSGSGDRHRAVMPAIERLGDFRIVREVGRGGMGVVFEAVQESLGRRVALKVLPQSSLLTGNQLQRFEREARTAAHLHHSNIVPVFGSGQSDGFHWYAMQFIDGPSLDRWRTENAERPPVGSGAWRDRARFVARIGTQAASALHYAHQQGTLHRDIKPANLLLEGEDHVWVTDFGLAKALEAEGLTRSSDLLGTLQYMAPEQFTGRYDVLSEVYALGVTLFELLTLQPAFTGRSRSELMQQVQGSRQVRLHFRDRGVPDDLAVIVERAMALDPEDRYRSAESLRKDLQAFIEDRPIEARRHHAGQLLLRWCRRNRAMAALAGCTLVAVLGAAVTGWVAARVADEKSRLIESNLQLMLAGFDDVFDTLVGRDPAMAVEEDPDTGEQTVVAPIVVEPRDVEVLQQMLALYDRFAAQNAGSQSLQFETARAYRRVGAIQARLGNLDAAANSYQQALLRFRDVVDRDVVREIAGVHVDYGQIEVRRGHLEKAGESFQLALQILGPDQPADSKVVRYERAQAHFLLGRRQFGGPGAGGGPPRPPERGPERGPEFGGRPAGGPRDRLRDPEARQHLAAAQAIVADLLRAEPANPEFRALQARCLLASGRRVNDGGEPDTDRDAALAIYRELTREHPDVDQYALDLCEALLFDVRRDRPPGGRPRGALPGDAPGNITNLREARDLAQRLAKAQPSYAEYRALRARVGTLLGRHLAQAAAAPGADAEQRAQLRREAEEELRIALAVETAGGGDAMAERRAMAAIGTRTSLAMLYCDTGRADEAREQARCIVESLRQFVAEPGPGARRPQVDRFLLESAETAVRRAASELAPEFRELRDRLPPDDRPERGGQQPRRR